MSNCGIIPDTDPLQLASPIGKKMLSSMVRKKFVIRMASEENTIALVVPFPTPTAPFLALSPWWQEIRTIRMPNTKPLISAM